ncbi:nuclear RNA export factor 1-like [Myxocyprinus asiaticus]|uniref:nuclear RNA export factor 1-like n=1 Tax=Myxocyprinus asiaticus TaxID=70543 RepID=UPI002221DE9E|nr:nuclear RNA export factor 1-like [Myxocyprinus asiaticus]
MTWYREWYPNLSLTTRVSSYFSGADGAASVREVTSSGSSLTCTVGPAVVSTLEYDSFMGNPQFCKRKGWGSIKGCQYNPVCSKQQGGPPGWFGPGPRSRFQDASFDLSEDDLRWKSQQSFIPYRKHSRRGVNVGRGGRKKWFKLNIPHGQNYDKTWLLTALQKRCPIPFTPLHYSTDGHQVHFYVEDGATASALCKLSRKITDSEGRKVVVFMNHCSTPPFLQSELKHQDLDHSKDDHVLPTTIGFDVETSTTIPPCKGSHFVSEEIKVFIQGFLQHYYRVYDSGDRQPLLEAYHYGACFSLTVPPICNPSRYGLEEYHNNSRNISKVRDFSKWTRMLKRSRVNVVACLNNLPQTQHDIASFTVDVNTYTKTLLMFTVSGAFKEVDGTWRESVKAFSRVFITVPAQNSGLCIVNDELFVRNATQGEIHRAFAVPAPTPSSSSVPTLNASQQEMISAFASNSQMNLEWSQKCLQDNGWNFNRAAQVFMALKVQGMIPEAAFFK